MVCIIVENPPREYLPEDVFAEKETKEHGALNIED